MIPLTAKQQELLAYLRSCEQSPSFAEMCEATSQCKSSIFRLLTALEERGFIRRTHNMARAANW